MYAPSSYNDTVTGETLSSVSEKSDSYSNDGSQPDYMVSSRFCFPRTNDVDVACIFIIVSICIWPIRTTLVKRRHPPIWSRTRTCHHRATRKMAHCQLTIRTRIQVSQLISYFLTLSKVHSHLECLEN